MATNTRISTKELILSAAFSFFTDELRYDDFSMNEVASKVGISKPAIYRHFKSKDELILAMQDKFFDMISAHLIKLNKNKTDLKVPFAETISFFCKNAYYINYLINQLSTHPGYISKMESNLVARNAAFSKFERMDKSVIFEQLFCGVSILFFIKARKKALSSISSKKYSEDDFSKKLVDLITKGLSGMTQPDSLIHPTDISPERFAYLESICKLNKEDFPEEDKVFTALAKVIEKHKLSGVTVEKIASELNMAKSSLYFYFDDKNQMIHSLIQKELSLLGVIIRENTSEAQNYSEYLYISMLSELQFFMMRPSIIPICGWLLKNTINNPFEQNDEISSEFEGKLPEILEEPDLGFPLKRKSMGYWGGVIPVALVITAKQYDFTPEDINKGIKQIFEFIQNGIKCKNLTQ